MEQLKFRSSIKPALMQSALWRGTLLAGIGGMLLFIEGIFFPPSVLAKWGLPSFFLALALIAIGLLPYRRLCRLEMKPYVLVEDHAGLHFVIKECPLLSIPRVSIEKLEYFENNRIYGIGVILKKPLPEKVIWRSKQASLFASPKGSKYDLFLPYFTKRTLESIDQPTD